jgi:hypothetical protein
MIDLSAKDIIAAFTIHLTIIWSIFRCIGGMIGVSLNVFAPMEWATLIQMK